MLTWGTFDTNRMAGGPCGIPIEDRPKQAAITFKFKLLCRIDLESGSFDSPMEPPYHSRSRRLKSRSRGVVRTPGSPGRKHLIVCADSGRRWPWAQRGGESLGPIAGH